jgi:beta-1,4-N-acetylglucosaminyltransferase
MKRTGKETSKTVFVTVGSTKFENLINRVLEADILNLLKAHSYNKVILQVGNGHHKYDDLFNFSQANLNFKSGVEEVATFLKDNVEILAYRYKKSIGDDILNADLIISHAGAGSVMESLEANKKLIVVINEMLMDNHQLELAEKMHDEGYSLYTTCEGLREKIELINSRNCQLKTYARGQPSLFGVHLNKIMS